MNRDVLAGLAIAASLIMAAQFPQLKGPTHVKSGTFGKASDGKEAHLYTLTNKNGMEVAISDYGATIVFIQDRRSKRKVC